MPQGSRRHNHNHYVLRSKLFGNNVQMLWCVQGWWFWWSEAGAGARDTQKTFYIHSSRRRYTAAEYNTFTVGGLKVFSMLGFEGVPKNILFFLKFQGLFEKKAFLAWEKPLKISWKFFFSFLMFSDIRTNRENCKPDIHNFEIVLHSGDAARRGPALIALQCSNFAWGKIKCKF